MFMQLCKKSENRMRLKEFQKCMRMMCVKSNRYLVERIFSLIDVDRDQHLSFKEFMNYFNTLLKGDVNEKAELCFLLIAAGSEDNYEKSKDEKVFTWINLLELLILVQFTQEKSKLDNEGISSLQEFAKSIWKMLDAKEGEEITLKKFKMATEKNNELLDIFEMMADGLRDLMNNRGENKYLKLVRVLNKLKDHLGPVLDWMKAFSELEQMGSKSKYSNLTNITRRRKRIKSSILDNFQNKFKHLNSLSQKQADLQRLNTSSGVQKLSQPTPRAQNQSSSINNFEFNKSRNQGQNGFLQSPAKQGKNYQFPNSSILPEQNSSPRRVTYDARQLKKSTQKLTQESCQSSESHTIPIEKSPKYKSISNVTIEENEKKPIYNKIPITEKTNFLHKNSSVENLEEAKMMIKNIENGEYLDQEEDPYSKKIAILVKSGHDNVIKSTRFFGDQEENNSYKNNILLQCKKIPKYKKVKPVPEPEDKLMTEFESYLEIKIKEHMKEQDDSFMTMIKNSEIYQNCKNSLKNFF